MHQPQLSRHYREEKKKTQVFVINWASRGLNWSEVLCCKAPPRMGESNLGGTKSLFEQMYGR